MWFYFSIIIKTTKRVYQTNIDSLKPELSDAINNFINALLTFYSNVYPYLPIHELITSSQTQPL